MEKRQRKTIGEIKSSILDFLKHGPKPEKEIAENIGSNWTTTNNVLEELKSEGLTCEVSSNSKAKYYRRCDDPVFYSLPFSKEVRENTLALLKSISQRLEKVNKKPTPKTSIQKIAVKIIEENPEEFNLPILRFHYGQVVSLRYDDKIEDVYDIAPLTSKQNGIVEKYVEKDKGNNSTYLINEQYRKPEMIFFKTKNELLEKFEKSSDDLIDKIIELSAHFPIELESTYKLFERFESSAINLLNVKNPEENKEYKKELEMIFYLLWDSITTECFFYDSENFILDKNKEMFENIRSSVMNTKLANISPMIEDMASESESKSIDEIKIKTTDKSKELFHELMNLE